MISICPLERLYEVLPLGKRFFDYAKEKGVFSAKAALDFWTGVYQNKSGAMFIEESDGQVKGFFGLTFFIEPWTGDLNASEICWYSEGREGLKLLIEAEKAARQCGAKVMYLQHLENEDNARMTKYYVKKGFTLGYSRYLKEL